MSARTVGRETAHCNLKSIFCFIDFLPISQRAHTCQDKSQMLCYTTRLHKKQMYTLEINQIAESAQ